MPANTLCIRTRTTSGSASDRELVTHEILQALMENASTGVIKAAGGHIMLPCTSLLLQVRQSEGPVMQQLHVSLHADTQVHRLWVLVCLCQQHADGTGT